MTVEDHKMSLEAEVKQKVHEILVDYETDLRDALSTTLQWYYLTLTTYVGRRGDYCVLDRAFREKLTDFKDSVIHRVNMKYTNVSPAEKDTSTLLDEFSVLYSILYHVDDSKLIAPREQTIHQMDKVQYLLVLIDDYMNNNVNENDFK